MKLSLPSSFTSGWRLTSAAITMMLLSSNSVVGSLATPETSATDSTGSSSSSRNNPNVLSSDPAKNHQGANIKRNDRVETSSGGGATKERLAVSTPDQDHRNLVDLDTVVRRLTSCGSFTAEVPSETFIALNVNASDGFNEFQLIQFLEFEFKNQTSLACDPAQRTITSVTEIGGFDFDSFAAPFRGTVFRVEFEPYINDAQFKTTLLAPENDTPVTNTAVASGVTCQLNQVGLDSLGCFADSCYCPDNLIGQDTVGVTETQFLDGLNDQLEFYQDNMGVLGSIENFVDLIELKQVSCSGFRPREFVNMVFYFNVDPCAFGPELDPVVFDAFASVYDKMSFEKCQASFARIDQVFTYRDNCREPAYEPLMIEDEVCYPWVFEISYDTSDQSSPLFEGGPTTAPSGPFRERILQFDSSGKRQFKPKPEREQSKAGDEWSPSQERAERSLFTFQRFFDEGGGVQCFCSAFGPEPTDEPINATEFGNKFFEALVADDRLTVETNTPQVCDDEEYFTFDCRISGSSRTTTTRYVYLEFDEPPTQEGLELLEADCRIKYNNLVFETCPDDYFQVVDCDATYLIDESEVTSDPDITVDRTYLDRVLLRLSGFGHFGSPYSDVEEGPRPSRRRSQDKATASDQEDKLKAHAQTKDFGTGHNHRNRHLFFAVQGEGLDCLCKEGVEQGGSAPTLNDVYGDSVVRGTLLTDADAECPDPDVFEQEIFVAIKGDLGAVDSPETLAFEYALQGFFNDVSIGASPVTLGTCSPFFYYVFNVKRQGDIVNNIGTFLVQYEARGATAGDEILFRTSEDMPVPAPSPSTFVVDPPFPERRAEVKSTPSPAPWEDIPPTPSAARRVEVPSVPSPAPWEDAPSVPSIARRLDTPVFTPYSPYSPISPVFDPPLGDQCLEAVDCDDRLTLTLVELNEYLVRDLNDNGRFDGIPVTDVQIVEGTNQVFERIEPCDSADPPLEALIGVGVTGTLTEEQLKSVLQEAYTTRMLELCDEPFYRTMREEIGLEFNTTSSQGEYDEFYMFQVDINARGSPERALAPSSGDSSLSGSRKLSVSRELPFTSLPFCTVEDILNGPLSSEECSSDSCDCKSDGCYCPIGSEPLGGATAEDVLVEMRNIIDRRSIPGEGETRRRTVGSGTIVTLDEYFQVDCSGTEFGSVSFYLIIYLNIDPSTLTPTQVTDLEELVLNSVNGVLSGTCSESFFRATSVTLVSTEEERRALHGKDDKNENRRLFGVNGFIFDVSGSGSTGGGSTGGFGDFRRRMEEYVIPQIEVNPRVPTRDSSHRDLITVDNGNGNFTCYCLVEEIGQDANNTLELIVNFTNQGLDEIFPDSEADAFGGDFIPGAECPEEDLIDVETIVYVTLQKPIDELTEAEIDQAEADCLSVYNDISLANCGPDSILAVQCELQPYTTAAGTGRRLNDDRRLSSFSFTSGVFIIGGVGTSGSDPFNRGGTGDFRRLEWARNGAMVGGWMDGIDADHRRRMEEFEFCGCTGEDEGRRDLQSTSGGISFDAWLAEMIERNINVIRNALDVREVNCTEGDIFPYQVEVDFETDISSLPAENITAFEDAFIAESNELAVKLCDPEHFIVISADLDLTSDPPVLDVLALQRNGANASTPLFEDEIVMRRLEETLSILPLGVSAKNRSPGFFRALTTSRVRDDSPRFLQAFNTSGDVPCFCEESRTDDVGNANASIQEQVTVSEVNMELNNTEGVPELIISNVVAGEDSASPSTNPSSTPSITPSISPSEGPGMCRCEKYKGEVYGPAGSRRAKAIKASGVVSSPTIPMPMPTSTVPTSSPTAPVPDKSPNAFTMTSDPGKMRTGTPIPKHSKPPKFPKSIGKPVCEVGADGLATCADGIKVIRFGEGVCECVDETRRRVRSSQKDECRVRPDTFTCPIM